MAGQTLSLVGIFILSLSGREVSLLEIACVYTVSPLLVYVASYPLTFTRYKYLRPSLCLFDKKELDGLFSLGIKFFFVQIAGLVIFATSNILISRLLSPADVTPYQISYKYFSLTIMLFTLIAAPLWSATTDAYTKGDWVTKFNYKNNDTNRWYGTRNLSSEFTDKYDFRAERPHFL